MFQTTNQEKKLSNMGICLICPYSIYFYLLQDDYTYTAKNYDQSCNFAGLALNSQCKRFYHGCGQIYRYHGSVIPIYPYGEFSVGKIMQLILGCPRDNQKPKQVGRRAQGSSHPKLRRSSHLVVNGPMVSTIPKFTQQISTHSTLPPSFPGCFEIYVFLTPFPWISDIFLFQSCTKHHPQVYIPSGKLT